MIIRKTCFCFVLIPLLSSMAYILHIEEPLKDLNYSRLLLHIINNYFRNETCLHIIDDFGLVTTDNTILSSNEMGLIPTILMTQITISSKLTENILSMAIRKNCRCFLIAANNNYKISKLIYNISVNYTNSYKRRYVFLSLADQKVSQLNLSNDFKRLSPNTFIVKPLPSSSGSNTVTKYEILTFQVDNNLKPGSVIQSNIWNGETLNNNNLFPDKFANLHGISIQVAILDYPPYCFVTNQSFEGSEIRAITEVSRKYNFTLNIMVATDGFGVVFHENGSVSGLCGVVLHGKPEMGIAGIYNIDYIHERFYLTTTYYQSAVSFLTPKPKRLSYLWYVFLPFDVTLWSVILGFLLLRTLFFIGFATVQQKIRNQSSSKYSSDLGYVLLNNISIQLGIPISNPPYASLHHILNWSFMVSLLTITAYSCNLVSFLTVPLFSEPIETLQQFADSGLQWGINDMSWLNSFEGATDPRVVLIKDRYLYLENMTELNNLVRERKIAILVEKVHSGGFTNVDFLAGDAIKNLYLMKEDPIRVYVSTILKRGSPLVTKLNHVYKWLRDTGIFTYWDKEVFDNFMPKELSSALVYEPEKDDSPCVLQMKHLNGAFVCLIIGLCLGLFVFLCEMSTHAVFDRLKL